VPFRRQGNLAEDGIDNPPEELFLGGPVCVAKKQLLDRIGSLSVTIAAVVGPKEQIKRMKNMPSSLDKGVRVALAKG
jgi:hypothetical protein